MKICVYVLSKNAKQNYANESYNVRQNAGTSVVVDILRRAGYEAEYASGANVHNYDVVLVSITSDCDWWPFIAERVKWRKGNYKVIAGGAGLLNVRPFLPFVDYFVLGRAEGIIDKLIKSIDIGASFDHPSVIISKQFSPSEHYTINQVTKSYPHQIILENGKTYTEGMIGCNHRCLFCGYTWHRKSTGQEFKYGDMWAKNEDVEIAILNYAKGQRINLNKLRTTAIDGLSERLRSMVNKPITRDVLRGFVKDLATCGKPHQVKIYNIIGYPTETEDDWWEFVEDIKTVDSGLAKSDKQTSLLLHSTPFRPMPATPAACWPMSYRNYRGEIARVLGRGYKGNIFYQGNALWAVESMATESLPTVIQSAIIWRGTEKDTENITRIACSTKYNSASALVKQATLEKYFDVKTLFGAFTAETLPTKYLRTYAKIEKAW
jgi:radical SAM superfamily enzyme YgiQ (UPF0313 family)